MKLPPSANTFWGHYHLAKCNVCRTSNSCLAAVIADCKWMASPGADLLRWPYLVCSHHLGRDLWLQLVTPREVERLRPLIIALHDCAILALPLFCNHCSRSCGTMNGLYNHVHRSHGYISPTRLYASDFMCHASSVMFGSRPRTI